MPDREVTIKISAKNLTEAQFRQVKQGLGGLGNSAKGATQKTSGLKRAFASFGKAAPGALKIVTAAAAVAGAAIVGTAAAVVKLAQRGAELESISKSFNNLTAAVGESGAVMVATTRTATKGLITDLDIMGAANKGLLLGLPITESSMGELAQTSVVLGKAMGQGAGKSLDDLITALGRASPMILDNLGLTVKVGDANEAYAKKLGKSTAALTEAEKKTAFYEAALEAARAKVAEVGGVQLTLGDHIQRGVVSVTNFVNSLSMVLSKSPPLIAGMQAIRDVISQAFGGDQSGLVLTIVNLIERAAITVLTFAETGVKAAKSIYQGFAGIKLLVLGVGIAFTELQGRVAEMVASTFEAAASVPVLGGAFKIQAEVARSAAEGISLVNTAMKAEAADALAAAVGNDTFTKTLDRVATGVRTVKDAVVNAGLSQREFNAATAEGVTQSAAQALAEEEKAARIKAAVEDWGMKYRENLGLTGSTTKRWAEEEKAAFAMVAGEQGIGKLKVEVAAAGSLVAVQTAAMTAAFASFGIQTKTEMEAMVKALEDDFDKIKKSGLATDKDLADSAKKLKEAKATLRGEDLSHQISTNEALLGSSLALFGALGSKFKAAAIAGAIISTYMAIAKSLGAYPWPFNLVAAAAAGVAGWMNVAKIKSSKEGMRAGTMGLDYQDFGTSTPAVLHGREAVIPQGGGHKLAEEISGALARKSGAPRDTDIMVERFERIGSKLDTLPRAIQRAVRDGMLLAAV